MTLLHLRSLYRYQFDNRHNKQCQNQLPRHRVECCAHKNIIKSSDKNSIDVDVDATHHFRVKCASPSSLHITCNVDDDDDAMRISNWKMIADQFSLSFHIVSMFVRVKWEISDENFFKIPFFFLQTLENLDLESRLIDEKASRWKWENLMNNEIKKKFNQMSNDFLLFCASLLFSFLSKCWCYWFLYLEGKEDEFV